MTQQVISTRLYGNNTLFGISGANQTKVNAIKNAVRERVTYNVVQSVIDTVGANVAENKPKPYFLTSGGTSREQRKAKKLNQFVDGIFYENNAYDLGGMTFRDGCIGGDGVIHVFAKHQRVAFERVMAAELWVDEVEAMYGFPRQMHRVKNIDRGELAGYFPGKASAIGSANPPSAQDIGNIANISDMVAVRESWHLPSFPGAKDGKHIITVDGAALTPMEPWNHDFFPFARFSWCPRPLGFWSQGLAEQLQNIQLEVNKLLFLIQRSMHLAGTFKVFLQNGSKIVKEHINNDIGAIVNYTGQPPTFYVPQVVPPEYYGHLSTLIERAYQQGGVSQLAAAAKKPEGLDSGKAIRAYKDNDSDRFRTIGRYNDKLYLDLAKMAIATAKDIAAENGGTYEVTVPGKKFLRKMDWGDIDLEADEYVMQCFPVSKLPSDPAGRLETVQEYIQAGMLSPRQGKRLLDFPDLEQVEGLQNAAEDLLTSVLDAIVDEGEYSPPEPTDDLDLAKELVLEYLALGRMQALEPERMELLRCFSTQVDTLLSMATSPSPAPVAEGPQAQAAPPPTSDLIQNVPGLAPAA
jgi:hypothetical protein